MKKSLAILTISASLFLSACGGGDSDSENGDNGETSNKTTYETSEFAINIPSDWEIIDSSNLTSNIPSDVVVAFRNNVKSETFTANANVTITELGEETNLEDFAKNSLAKIKINLIDFKEINSEEYELSDEDVPAHILEFQGKQSASEMPITFRQIYVANGTTIYIVTSAYLTQEEEGTIQSLDEILNSFTLK